MGTIPRTTPDGPVKPYEAKKEPSVPIPGSERPRPNPRAVVPAGDPQRTIGGASTMSMHRPPRGSAGRWSPRMGAFAA